MTERLDVRAALTALGWNSDDDLSRAISDYQRGCALPGRPALLVDGKAGPKTQAALRMSLARLRAGQGTASEHFSYSEFRCRCGGRYARCATVRVHRDLLIGLETYRAAVRRAVTVVSGYRCPQRNAEVGGATSSQHVYGAAADVEYAASDVAVRRLRRFSGIGRSAKTRKVRHVDVRHVSGNNTTGGTPDRPTIWNYAA